MQPFSLQSDAALSCADRGGEVQKKIPSKATYPGHEFSTSEICIFILFHFF